jgi:phenylalanyl-tRNA synthetase beta chain
MKFSENWLRTLVDPALSSQALAHALTMAGLEVEALEPVAAAFTRVVVGEVLSKDKHPDADRLNVLNVNVGEATPLQIVCGAGNVTVGMKAPCALVGAELPGFNIKQAKVRGIESFGMMCSEKELGLAEDSAGLMELPADAPVGQDIRAYLDLNDTLFALKLTPNRSDCLSVAGVAREVAAVTGAPLNALDIGTVAPSAGADGITVKVADAEACPRYCGRVLKGVDAAAATPEWMHRRLARSGLRSISAVVDITNYVLLELGQPLHAFDLAKLKGDIEVRGAREGETLELLNQQTVELQSDMLVIADGNGAVALAGIMGGAATAVSEATRDIFLESAFFAPAAIAGKARRLGLSTDSSHRFERGVDFAATQQALERSTQLVLDICGGTAGAIIEVVARLPQRTTIRLRAARARSVLGMDMSDADMARLLNLLGLEFSQADGVFTVTPPSYRFDLAIEEDLIEELARLYGYDRIPAMPPHAGLTMLPVPETHRDGDAVRTLLAARDYQEVVTYSFVDESWEREQLGNDNPIKLRNPIASNMCVMRSSLFGGLLNTLVYNLNRKQQRVRLFEIGACFRDGFSQSQKLAGLCFGETFAEQWGEAARAVDFFDVKIDIEVIIGRNAVFSPSQHPLLHPGQCARVGLNGRDVGIIGALHPRWQQHFDLPQSAVLFEIDLQAALLLNIPEFSEVPKFPPVRRDLAVVVDETVSVQSMIDAMRAESDNLISEVALFDVYRGKGIVENKKSLAFLVLMQDTQRTLTDDEADSAVSQLVAAMARQCGAVLRS